MQIDERCLGLDYSVKDCAKRCDGYKRCKEICEVVAASKTICFDCIHKRICKVYKIHYYVYLSKLERCKYKKVKDND